MIEIDLYTSRLRSFVFSKVVLGTLGTLTHPNQQSSPPEDTHTMADDSTAAVAGAEQDSDGKPEMIWETGALHGQFGKSATTRQHHETSSHTLHVGHR